MGSTSTLERKEVVENNWEFMTIIIAISEELSYVACNSYVLKSCL